MIPDIHFLLQVIFIQSIFLSVSDNFLQYKNVFIQFWHNKNIMKYCEYLTTTTTTSNNNIDNNNAITFNLKSQTFI